MKLVILLVINFYCCTFLINAQDTIVNKKIYRTWIYQNCEPARVKGFLYETKDSSVFVVKESALGESYLQRYHYSNIETVKIRRNNNLGKGILIGSLTGIAIGSLIAIHEGPDPSGFISFSVSEKAFIYSTPLAIVGGIVGGFVGSFKIKIPINGNLNSYRQREKDLINYSLISK